METPSMEPSKNEIGFDLGDKVKFLKDGREGHIVVENDPSLLPEGIVEVEFADGVAEGVQVSDLEKIEESESKAEEE